MIACKFCSAEEGAQGRSNKTIHVDRDGLCGPCATLFNKVRYQPEKLVDFDRLFYAQQCDYNYRHNRFVPRDASKELAIKYPKEWSCYKCAETNATKRDEAYVKYCIECAGQVRNSRLLPLKSTKKTRSDKGSTHERRNNK